MKTRHTLPTIIALILCACGGEGPELDTRTFRLESLSSDEASRILEPYVYYDRETNPGTMNTAEGAVTVRETPDNLGKIARVLEEFDRSAPRVRLTFQVIEANGSSEPDPTIADVVDELRRLFRYEGYRLVGNGVVTVGDYASFRHTLSGSDQGWMVQGGAVPRGDAVRLEAIQLMSASSGNLIETSATIRPGQTLVLGSARDLDQDRNVILVVRADEVD